MLIHQLACINIILTHCMLFIKTVTHNKVTILDPHKQGTSWSLHDSSPNYCDIKTPQNPKTSVSGSKQNPNSVRNCPKTVLKFQLGLSENIPKNSARTVPKQSQNYTRLSENSLKNSYTQSKNLGTEIYGLSRPLSQSQAIKWPLG